METVEKGKRQVGRVDQGQIDQILVLLSMKQRENDVLPLLPDSDIRFSPTDWMINKELKLLYVPVGATLRWIISRMSIEVYFYESQSDPGH